MIVLAIDPGPVRSAWVAYGDGNILDHEITDNDRFLAMMRSTGFAVADRLAVEMIASYGMPVGREVFDTCVMIGRIIEAYENRAGGLARLIYRKDVKLHLCGQTRAKDANVRTAIIDRFGGKLIAVGTSKSPGPLYGIKADEWQALAVALTFADQEVE